jgi:diaminopimelate decarboxylase
MAREIPLHLAPPTLRDADALLARVARTRGTPLFVYDNAVLAQSWRALRECVPPQIDLHYSVKANPLVAMVEALAGWGAGFEVSSPGEWEVLRRAQVDPARAIYLGPGKTEAEIATALRGGVGRLVAESAAEAQRILRAGRRWGVPAPLALRLNLGQGAGALSMGGLTPFGMEIDAACAFLAGLDPAQRDTVGLHAFLGTRLLRADDLLAGVSRVLAAVATVEKRTGARIPFIDLGGGFGVPLYEGEAPLDLGAVSRGLDALTGTHQAQRSYPVRFAMETGRFLVASCGVLLTRVVDVKRTHGVTFVIVDGGAHVLGGRDGYLGARPGPMKILKGKGRPLAEVTVCGPLCTPMDRMASRVLLPRPRPGDVLAFYGAGAYGPTASAGRFLSRGYPAEVWRDGERLSTVRRRETATDLLRGQRSAMVGEATA